MSISALQSQLRVFRHYLIGGPSSFQKSESNSESDDMMTVEGLASDSATFFFVCVSQCWTPTPLPPPPALGTHGGTSPWPPRRTREPKVVGRPDNFASHVRGWPSAPQAGEHGLHPGCPPQQNLAPITVDRTLCSARSPDGAKVPSHQRWSSAIISVV
jgi:hypothetical protein